VSALGTARWLSYELTYRAAAPVALGAQPLGFIQRTRLYAPGWTLWGAITAQLTRAGRGRATGADYEAVGRFVRDNLPTSYAYVLVDGCPASPRYDEQGRLCYGTLSAAEFEARFVASVGQTAIAPATLSAAVGSLHETEVIAAHDRASGAPVRWRLTLFARQPWAGLPEALDGLSVEAVLDALRTLTLGADRGYGLGRLTREGDPAPGEKQAGAWPRPLDWDKDKSTLAAHLDLDALAGKWVRGRVEPVVRRLWQTDPREGSWGPGQKRVPRVLYAPGSRVMLPGWQPVVGPLGIWRGKGAVGELA